MFDVGFTEVFLIGVVSLVVIGPERLPAVAKTAGQWIGKLQRFVKGVKTDLASELESGDLKKLIGDQREQIDELRNMVATAKKDFQSTAQSVAKSTKEGMNELEATVNDAKAEVAQLNDADAEQNTADSADAKLSKPESPEVIQPNIGKPASVEKPASEPAPTTRTGTSDNDGQ